MWASQLSDSSHSTLTRCWKLCFSSIGTCFKKATDFFVTILSWGLWETGNPGHSEKDGYQTLKTWSPLFLDPWPDPSLSSSWGAPGPPRCDSSQGRNAAPVSSMYHFDAFSCHPNWEQNKLQQIKILFRIKTRSSRTTYCLFLKFIHNFIEYLIDTNSCCNFEDLQRKKLKSVVFLVFHFVEKTKNM